MRHVLSVLILFICGILFMFFLLMSYENEDSLLEDFNNKVEGLTKSGENVVDYKPSIQLAVNDKSRVQQGYIEDILRNERLLFQWSRGLSEKYSGHYLVLMSSENKNPILVDIAKFQPTTTIQASGLKIEIVSRKAHGKYDFEIQTKIGSFERIENKNCYDLKSDVVYISSYDIDNKHYWLYSLIVR